MSRRINLLINTHTHHNKTVISVVKPIRLSLRSGIKNEESDRVEYAQQFKRAVMPCFICKEKKNSKNTKHDETFANNPSAPPMRRLDSIVYASFFIRLRVVHILLYTYRGIRSFRSGFFDFWRYEIKDNRPRFITTCTGDLYGWNMVWQTNTYRNERWKSDDVAVVFR